MKNFTMIMMVAMLSVGSVFAQTISFKVGVWESADAFESHIYGATVLLEEVGNATNMHSVDITYIYDWAGPFPLLNDVPYGSYNVTVSADGYHTYTTVLDVDENVGNDNVFYLERIATSLEEINELTISVYPNPTTGLVNISTEVEKVEVYNVSGSLVKVVNGPALTGFDISDLSNGLYVLKVTDSNNETALIKINKK
ncbi:T9SS type A sorting domain-containing protein [Saccharicrinis aurantiacus]|uniref:T9SS type A sorting domain-containing protein n=1 Tax=Saccharicrinis aurantiacus TaxID=1849719 RepID=UPI00094FC616|nr:T9SS type A sorting domain-containing protein [Saccharicrinis aurantiacus]